MAVPLGVDALSRYQRFSLYNSPYTAHDRGHAVDLYPDSGLGPAETSSPAPSPVAGEVLETRTVRAPPKPYAPDHDHLILVDTGAHVARILHVEPEVEPGDSIEVGDPLGSLVRAGFFAPWVDNHLHLELRAPDENPYRASGSLALDPEVEVEALDWDGSGKVVETGETYVVLDAPAHPAPGERFVGIASDEGRVLDGGLVHYAGGGALGASAGSVSLFGHRIGRADGRTVAWEPLEILANDVPITGLSLCCARDPAFGAKLVCPGHAFAVGDRIEVDLRPTDDPIRLG